MTMKLHSLNWTCNSHVYNVLNQTHSAYGCPKLHLSYCFSSSTLRDILTKSRRGTSEDLDTASDKPSCSGLSESAVCSCSTGCYPQDSLSCLLLLWQLLLWLRIHASHFLKEHESCKRKWKCKVDMPFSPIQSLDPDTVPDSVYLLVAPVMVTHKYRQEPDWWLCQVQ